jgi:hypothetical protein
LDLNPITLFSVWLALTLWVLVYAKHCAAPLMQEVRRWLLCQK